MTQLLYQNGKFVGCLTQAPDVPEHGDLLFRLYGAHEEEYGAALEALGMDYRTDGEGYNTEKWVMIVRSGSVKCVHCGRYFLPGPMLKAVIDSWGNDGRPWDPTAIKCGCVQYEEDMRNYDGEPIQRLQLVDDRNEYDRYDQFREGSA